jgi:hypothetical protein
VGDSSFDRHGTEAPTFDPSEIAPFAVPSGAFFLNVRWDQLQSDASTAIEPDNPIDWDLAGGALLLTAES